VLAQGEAIRRRDVESVLARLTDVQAELAERRRLEAIIEERFGLDPNKAAELTALAEQSDRKAVDFYQFTSLLKHALDNEGRLKVVEMLWEIAFADHVLHELEENTIWRIAELLGVSSRDRILLRQKIAGEAQRNVSTEGPWSASAAKGKP
jgi:uncharacterized tellurite resistance protein B-like protein